MSTASPSRGLRAKTSDLTDFFRGAGHSSLQTRQSTNDISTASTPSMALEVPSSCDEGAAPKKKITRIPLFGRSRKKSNQSTNSSPFASSGGGRYSSEGGELSSASRGPSTDTRHPAEPLISIQPPPLPANKHNSSLTSKFAAHFSHSRSSKALVNQADSASVKPAAKSSSSSSGLQPPGTRSSSLESGSSNGTKSRSTTPRPAPKPTITISLTADDYDEYKDLFSRPDNETPSTVRGPKAEGTLASTSTRSPEGSSTYRRGQTPAAAIAAAVRHQHTSSINGSEKPPSPPPKNSKNSSDRRSHERNDGSSTPRQYDSVRESPRPSDVVEKGLPPSLQRRASVAVGSAQFPESTSISSRSRMKQPSSPSRSKPPSIPLPLPPTPTLPSSSIPPNVSSSPGIQHPKTDSISSFSSSRADGSSRPRAHTISAVSSSRSSSRLSRSTAIKPPTPPTPPLAREKEGFNIETASADDLRQALMERNLQYDELATFVLKMTEAHVAEVTGLEKKINNYEKKVASLESEVLKQEKTIQGMIHIIKEQDEKHQQQEQERKSHPPSAILNNSRFASRGTESDPESPKSGPSAMRRRLNYHSDSGGESYATSGAESLRASGGSGTDSLSSIFRNKKLRRPYPLGDSAYIASRTGSLLRSSKIPPAAGPPEKSLPDVPSSSNPKRASSSMSPSPSSSASSLLPPSPSVTMSSLSAIPEGLASSLRPPRRGTGSEPADDRRTTYSSNRASTSSMTSSSTAASSSYSAHIKRSRPPSIAQVLEKSPKIDNVLDKLRPFS